MALRKRIDEGFERWGRMLVRRHWPAIASMLALAAGLGAQLPALDVDNSVEAFLHADDPKLIHYNEFRDDFGRDDVTVIAIRPREVFDHAGFLERPSIHYLYLRIHEAEQSRLEEWQLLPGDHDDV